MPKYGNSWFSGGPYGQNDLAFTNFKNTIRRIPLGFKVRKQLGKKFIFRVIRGNGHAGSVKGKLYQEKFKYFVPSSINNPEGQPARDAFSQASYNWKNVLTDEQKAEYHRLGRKHGNLQGRVYYMGLYIKNAL